MDMEEYLKELEALRRELEKKKEELQKEIEKIDSYIKAIENLITEKSFVTADKIVETPPPTKREAEPSPPDISREPVEKVKPAPIEEKPMRKDVLFIFRGRPIAWVELYRNKSIVLIDRDFGLPINDTLITKFLEPRFRDEMAKDMREIEEGKRPPDKRFTYVIHDEDGIVTKIEMLDFGEEMRRRDNLSKIRWVLKKYIEKRESNQGPA